MKIFQAFLVACFLMAMAVSASADSTWRNDNLNWSGPNLNSMESWQMGVRADLVSRGIDEVGGFVSPNASLSESAYLWHRLSGIYIQIQNTNSLNGEKDFGDNQAYSIGIYRKIFLNDMFVDAGYTHYNLWGLNRGLNTNIHSVYGGIYLPRIFANQWCDGFRFYTEAQGYTPDDRSVMRMGGGFVARVGVKSKFFSSSPFIPNGIDVDFSTGGNDGVFGRDPDIIGFESLKLATKYFNVANLGIDVEPYVIGLNQNRPGQEENKFTVSGGLRMGADF